MAVFVLLECPKMVKMWYNTVVLQDNEKHIKSTPLRPFVHVLQDLSTAAVMLCGGLAMIYFISDEARKHVKIGYTGNDDASGRLSQIQIGSPQQLEIIYTMPGSEINERRLHKLFASSYERGEWFRYTFGIAFFLALPQPEQVVISESTVGDSLTEVLMHLYLCPDGNTELMILRYMALLCDSGLTDFNRTFFPDQFPVKSDLADELFENVNHDIEK